MALVTKGFGTKYLITKGFTNLVIVSVGSPSVTTYSVSEHTLTLNLGTQELLFRHLSDVQISSLRQSVPASEEVNDTTGLPSVVSN